MQPGRRQKLWAPRKSSHREELGSDMQGARISDCVGLAWTPESQTHQSNSDISSSAQDLTGTNERT